MGDAPLPAAGSKILADGKPAGTVGSISNERGLALLRLDRASKAQVLSAEGVEIKASIQDWVTFSWPQENSDA